MSSSGLYEWLLKVVSVSGTIGPDGEDWMVQGLDVPGSDEHSKKEDKDKDKRALLGRSSLSVTRLSKLISFQQVTPSVLIIPSNSHYPSSCREKPSCDINYCSVFCYT
jgi:hypothetical protein